MIDVSNVRDVPVVRVDEDIDISSAPELRSVLGLASSGHDRLVISFERCPYCDAGGITVLLEFQRRFRDRLAVVVTRETQLRRVLGVLGLLRILNIFDSVESAIAHLASEEIAGTVERTSA